MVDKYKEKVRNMRWSFSRLNSWSDGCKYCWFQNYILKRKDSEPNAFSDYGSLVHELLEQYAKGEISKDDLSILFQDRFYDEVSEFPPNDFADLRETYFNSAIRYFENFDEFEGYEILEVEPEVKLDINGYEFIGYIDLIVKNVKNDKIVIVDHKSKAGFKDANEAKKYARQLYLYSKYVYEKYGRFPDLLVFNMFRKQKKKTIIFKEKDYNEAIDWMMSTIDDIMNTTEFSVTEDDFFGNELCNFRYDFLHILGQKYTLEELWDEKTENITEKTNDIKEVNFGDNVKLYLNDCLKLEIPKCRLLLTDIPYEEVNRSDNGLRNLNKEKADEKTFEIGDFLNHIYDSAEIFIIFCGNEQYSEIYKFFSDKQKDKKGTVRQIIWAKSNPSPMNGEYIYLSGTENAVWFKKKGTGKLNSKCKKNFFIHSTGSSKYHPTEKNHKLLEELILDNTNEGDLVVDTCMGSGSTGIVSVKNNRKFLGIELEKKYFNISKERIEELWE